MEKLTHGLFKGRALFLREDTDDYEFIIYCNKSLYTVITTKDFEIKEIKDIIVDKDLSYIFENPNYLRISSFIKSNNKDDHIYFGHIVSDDDPDTYISFQIKNGCLNIVKKQPNAQTEIKESNRRYLGKMYNLITDISVVNDLFDIKYIVKGNMMYIAGQVRNNDNISLVFLQYDYGNNCILVEKEYYSEKYKIVATNMFLNKNKECLIYGYKRKIHTDEHDSEFFFLDIHAPFI